MFFGLRAGIHSRRIGSSIRQIDDIVSYPLQRVSLLVVPRSTEATELRNAVAQGVAKGRLKDTQKALRWLGAGLRSTRVA